MPNYELAEAAAEDLRNIALYTVAKWGPKQAARYGGLFDTHFDAIGAGIARTHISSIQARVARFPD